MNVKIFAILLSGLMLVQGLNIQARDAYGLTELIEHFQYHSDNYGDDIFTFFSKHYGDLKYHHNKHHQKEDHNQLPFGHSYNLGSLTVFLFQKIKFSVIGNFKYFQTTNFFYLENYTSIERSDIFQPPRYT